jgi:uncharacterized protein (TIGR03118 family)
MTHHSSLRTCVRGLIAVGAALAVAAGASSAAAHPPSPGIVQASPKFSQVDLVADQPGRAPLTDPLLINPWGLAESPTSPLWVANNGLPLGSTTHTATIYSGGGVSPIMNTGKVVKIPGVDGPTGEVFNPVSATDITQFVVSGPMGGAGPAVFLWVTEGGALLAWNPTADPNNAIEVGHGATGAVYKGLALWQTPLGNFLLAADFHNARIDVFDSSFRRLSPLPDSFFHDPRLPAGYAPFNVKTVGQSVYVAYAKQDAMAHDDVPGAGFGFVDKYTDFGRDVDRVASRGPLNAPWGLAIAPASFGKFAGDLLVGNFGDGHISAYHGDDFAGQLRDTRGMPIAIDGLWALLPGTSASGGVGNVWFSAGPNGEAHGLVGLITP